MELYSLKVCCENEDCDWTGELGELHKHLINKCQYITERCQYECGYYYHRYALPVHEQDECPNRPLEVNIEKLKQINMQKQENELIQKRTESDKKQIECVHEQELSGNIYIYIIYIIYKRINLNFIFHMAESTI